MKINGSRLINDLKKLKEITDTPGEGVTRFSYGQGDREARKYIESIAKKYGLTVEHDGVGNIEIKPKNSKGTIIICSHIDTVKNGGWLDGIYGVISGIEILRTCEENKKEKDIALIIFAEEEGSRFGSTMTGSKFMTGVYNKKDIFTLVDDSGKSMESYLKENNFKSEKLGRDFRGVKAAFELHIEQGPILDKQNMELGIVDMIFGMKVIEVTLEGLGNHTGASPMEGRRDALCAMAEAALDVEKIASSDQERKTVATIGKIKSFSNCSNVIPEKVIFTIEVRDIVNKKIEMVIEDIIGSIKGIANKRNIKCHIRTVANSKAIPLSKKLLESMNKLATEKQLNFREMDSGAVHDIAMLAGTVDAGMIFVPSIDGRSHVPEEDTKEEDLINGAQFLFETVLMNI